MAGAEPRRSHRAACRSARRSSRTASPTHASRTWRGLARRVAHARLDRRALRSARRAARPNRGARAEPRRPVSRASKPILKEVAPLNAAIGTSGPRRARGQRRAALRRRCESSSNRSRKRRAAGRAVGSSAAGAARRRAGAQARTDRNDALRKRPQRGGVHSRPASRDRRDAGRRRLALGRDRGGSAGGPSARARARRAEAGL